jgi:hypothetical protein
MAIATDIAGINVSPASNKLSIQDPAATSRR